MINNIINYTYNIINYIIDNMKIIAIIERCYFIFWASRFVLSY